MNRVAMFLASAVLLTGSAFAQGAAAPEGVHNFNFTQGEQIKVISPDANMMFQTHNVDGDITVLGAEMMATGETVTGAPYTATAVTESTQVLADGNKIVNKTSSFIARDSQGRTRREDSIGRIGSLQSGDHKMVFIMDPTKHTQYISQEGGEATKVVRPDSSGNSGPQIIELHSGQYNMKSKFVKTITVDRQSADTKEDSDQVKHEDLGTQTIAGVSAEGKRDTSTIPAGKIGNDRPIEVVSETWYSPDLHATVMRKHSDPRVGETIYRLTDIQRVEPDPALFQMPAGEKTKVEHMLEMKRQSAPKE
ncbi:MAG TPA: hypothetical protein VGK22_20165 [Candidatus Angelobacter sp.]|jgi:hypothetical protein